MPLQALFAIIEYPANLQHWLGSDVQRRSSRKMVTDYTLRCRCILADATGYSRPVAGVRAASLCTFDPLQSP